ncbi:MAG: toxin ParE1/3/4 [Verrucomicrobiales bacterium]|jgi:toxin ParE1/3/4
MRLRFHPEAIIDLEAAATYYKACAGTELAEQFESCYLAAERLVIESPLRWRKQIHHTRRVNLMRFPYHIAYFIWEETIWIVAVAHSSRRPNFWKDRFKDVTHERSS